MTIISTIRAGYRIQTEAGIFTVLGSTKMRSGYKYIVKSADGRKACLDREDVLQAQREGSATVLGAA